VFVLHGGPGAPGHMAPVARGLANQFRVIEPFQRSSGAEPLTVARHVEDLHELVELHKETERPALVGSSWGAMLVLAYAAAHPASAGPLALIGCGTFDRAARARMDATLEERGDDAFRLRLARLDEELPDPDERLKARAALITPLYMYDPIPARDETVRCDARGHEEAWKDMVRLQDAGVYPAAFASIRSPVLMLHGTHDPHPGRMIRDSLAPYLPHLEYREWERCGHFPWLEKAVCEEFFTVLREWLRGHGSARMPSRDREGAVLARSPVENGNWSGRKPHHES
jgi:pimeloyl-ACP methyl ester carboxylesterase